ncbi:dTDP-glucose 4,6-dehydratase [Candidatus Endolissoclinum faulkneri L2]|uniref:dTDP-glucose 4,6-dehydratase n=1 Tax=Candidatus Endolissoclinum faulkneri L2 TaxID=1193729 RepID=K7YHJ9_9PROT|nr:dTDP-glucose 4,6-dehydratase [Candidatus Endolissoclinum faulkneri]AFX99045.1 dTDP-glucose 4,6-dehydratase [Candidatus Endolissoclinum faulkneri L2]
MIKPQTIVVTGGDGFIGSAVIRLLIAETDVRVVNLDKLTYAASGTALRGVENSDRYNFEQVDITDLASLKQVFNSYDPDAVMHLAAESHVDRSISMPESFIQTNVIGTFRLLQAAYQHFAILKEDRKDNFRFHHISTDEVFGSLGMNGMSSEESCYNPRSPYSASKASSDHLVRAWGTTYGLPIVVSSCSNNYGQFHFPEKLIPLMIIKGIRGESMPIYGDGSNIRDWLFVEDHAKALWKVLSKGAVGNSYNISGYNEISNLEVVEKICDLLDLYAPPLACCKSRRELITFVTDRLGHDFRYALNAAKIKHDLGWRPEETFSSGIEKTVRWYIDNEAWWRPLLDRKMLIPN